MFDFPSSFSTPFVHPQVVHDGMTNNVDKPTSLSRVVRCTVDLKKKKSCSCIVDTWSDSKLEKFILKLHFLFHCRVSSALCTRVHAHFSFMTESESFTTSLSLPPADEISSLQTINFTFRMNDSDHKFLIEGNFQWKKWAKKSGKASSIRCEERRKSYFQK